MKNLGKFFILGTLILAGCATSMKVQSDYDESADFSNLKTYAWETGVKQNEDISEDTDRCIRQAVDSALQLKGYQKVSLSPDLKVRYELTVEEKTETLSVGQPYSPVDISGGVVQVNRTWQSYEMMKRMETMKYDQGTLILDIVDERTNKHLWRGSVSAIIDPSATPQKRETRINEAVGKVLASFPRVKTCEGACHDRG